MPSEKLPVDELRGIAPAPVGWRKVYRRGWITPAVGRNRAHALRYAF